VGVEALLPRSTPDPRKLPWTRYEFDGHNNMSTALRNDTALTQLSKLDNPRKLANPLLSVSPMYATQTVNQSAHHSCMTLRCGKTNVRYQRAGWSLTRSSHSCAWQKATYGFGGDEEPVLHLSNLSCVWVRVAITDPPTTTLFIADYKYTSV